MTTSVRVRDQLECLRENPLVKRVWGRGLGWGIELREDGGTPPLRVRVSRHLARRARLAEPNPNLPGLRLTALTIGEPDLMAGLAGVARTLASQREH